MPLAPAPTRPVERPHPLTVIAKTWILLVATAWFLLQEVAQGTHLQFTRWGPILQIFIVIVVLQLAFGIGDAIFTRFVADASEFRIEKRFIWTKSDKIAYNKIQSVDVLQPFAARLLGLARLHVDVGGGQGKTIEFLARRRAYELRDYLLVRAHGQAASPDEIATDSSNLLSDVQQSDEVLVRATPAQLILAALLSTWFLWLLIPAVISTWLAVDSGVWGIAVPWLLPLAGFIAARVIGNWNFTLARGARGLKITRGLTTLASQSLPRHRIQGIRITQGILWRLVGIYQVQVTVLGYRIGEDDSASSNVAVPAGTWADVRVALAAIWPGFEFDSLVWQTQPEPAKWLTWATFRTHGWSLGEQLVGTRRGLLVHKIDLVPYARMQSVALRQGPLQRRLGLSRVFVHLSPGAVDAEAGYLEEASGEWLVERLAELGRSSRSSDLEMSALLDGPSAGGEHLEPLADDRHVLAEPPVVGGMVGEEAPVDVPPVR